MTHHHHLAGSVRIDADVLARDPVPQVDGPCADLDVPDPVFAFELALYRHARAESNATWERERERQGVML